MGDKTHSWVTHRDEGSFRHLPSRTSRWNLHLAWELLKQILADAQAVQRPFTKPLYE